MKKRCSSYKGEISSEVPNLLSRDFPADASGKKLLTDITEFNILAGKVYLSPLADCYDGDGYLLDYWNDSECVACK